MLDVDRSVNRPASLARSARPVGDRCEAAKTDELMMISGSASVNHRRKSFDSERSSLARRGGSGSNNQPQAAERVVK
jgi:hypothetical protein